MGIKFRASALLVKDINSSRSFYEELLEQKVEFDHGECISFYEGFAIWQKDHAHNIMKIKSPENTYCKQGPYFELYFETDDLESVIKKISERKVEFVHEVFEQPWGQRVFRVFDPDGYIIEIGEPMEIVVKRYMRKGMTPEQVAERTSMHIDFVIKQIDKVE